MFVIRQISFRYLRRYHSTLPTDLIKTSSSSTNEITRSSPTDSSLWATSETNHLIDYLSKRIQSAGPITVADYMREAFFHSKYVRYCSRVCFVYLDGLFFSLSRSRSYRLFLHLGF